MRGRLTVVGGASWAIEALVGGRVEIARQQPGPVLALAVLNGSRRSLVVVDLDDGGPRPEVSLGPDPVAAPLPVDRRVYVPTVTDGGEPVLRRFDLPDLVEGEPVPVPNRDGVAEPEDGDLGYDAFLEGTRLWANDPRSERALTVGEDEDPREVNKLDPTEADGDGAAADEAEELPDDEPPIPEPPTPGAADPGTGSEPPIPTPPTADPEPPSADPGPTVPALPPAAPPRTEPTEPDEVDVRVPDVTDVDPETACARLARADLACEPEAVEDDEREVDVVFAQVPEAGAEVPGGTAVTVRFAVRSRTEVPALEGLSSAEATTALQAAGLEPDPQERTDGGPQDPLDVVLPGQEPAADEEVDTGSTVTFSYFTARAPIPFDPAPLLGLPQDQACPTAAQQGFTVCAATPGDPAPTRDQEGRVYAVDPAAAGQYPPEQTITPFFYGPYQPQTRTMPALSGLGCEPVDRFNAENPGMNVVCAPAVSGPPPGITPYNAVVSHTPAQNEVVTEGQTVTVYLYQPALRTVIDWQRISPEGVEEATHTLRGPEEGVPGDGSGRTWQDTGARMQLFAGPEPGVRPGLLLEPHLVAGRAAPLLRHQRPAPVRQPEPVGRRLRRQPDRLRLRQRSRRAGGGPLPVRPGPLRHLGPAADRQLLQRRPAVPPGAHRARHQPLRAVGRLLDGRLSCV